VSEILRLEYACTPKELEEAQELNLRRQIGRGSKWRTNLILLSVLAVTFVGLYFRIAKDVPKAYRPYVVAALLVLILVVVLWLGRSRRASRVTSQLDVSDAHITIRNPESTATMPWSEFSQCLESPNLFVLVDRAKILLVIVPKRVFPDDAARSWFRAQATAASNAPPSIVAPPVEDHSADPNAIVVRSQLKYRDYLDRTIASWRTWAIVLGLIGVFGAIYLYSAAYPPPRAVYSATQVFFMAMLPFMLLMIVMIVFLNSFYHWRAHTHYLVTQETILSEKGVVVTSSQGRSEVAWTAFAGFKETRWSFILWGDGALWMLLPKRAFASTAEKQRCSALLAARLSRSRRFFG
jgi:hypothetical protein